MGGKERQLLRILRQTILTENSFNFVTLISLPFICDHLDNAGYLLAFLYKQWLLQQQTNLQTHRDTTTL